MNRYDDRLSVLLADCCSQCHESLSKNQALTRDYGSVCQKLRECDSCYVLVAVPTLLLIAKQLVRLFISPTMPAVLGSSVFWVFLFFMFNDIGAALAVLKGFGKPPSYIIAIATFFISTMLAFSVNIIDGAIQKLLYLALTLFALFVLDQDNSFSIALFGAFLGLAWFLISLNVRRRFLKFGF